MLRRLRTSFKKTKLRSPMRQYIYLAGLLISTDYKGRTDLSISDSLFDEMEDLVQGITDKQLYSMANVLLSKRESGQEEKDRLYSAFEAYDTYFNTTSLNYSEQVESRIKLLFPPSDGVIENEYGVTAEEMLDFYYFTYEQAQKTLDKAGEAFLAFRNITEGRTFKSEEEAFAEISKVIDPNELMESTSNTQVVHKKDVVERFGSDKAEKLLDLFVAKRHQRDFRYYSFEDNPFAEKPLVWLDEERFFLMFPSLLIDRIYKMLNDFLSGDPKFSKFKGDSIEDLTSNVFKCILGDEAKIYKKVCEKPKTDEHDLLIFFDKYVLIVEVKGSKVKAPRRDIEKSAVYLERHFFSPSGIGYAYNQAINLKEIMESNRPVTLYTDMNKETVFDARGEKILPIVVTLEQFGKIGINTSSLIKPKQGQPYPWVCCVDDLENILKIHEYLKIPPSRFIDYIKFRQKWHSHLFASDELELLEDYYAGKLKGLKKDTTYFVEPRGTSLIDKIYFESKGATYKYKYKIDGNK